MAKGNAKKICTLWQTKNDTMLAGEIPLEMLEGLVKAAHLGKHEAVKFLAFKGESKGGKKILDILAEPCDPYVRGESQREPTAPRSSW